MDKLALYVGTYVLRFLKARPDAYVAVDVRGESPVITAKERMRDGQAYVHARMCDRLDIEQAAIPCERMAEIHADHAIGQFRKVASRLTESGESGTLAERESEEPR